MDSVEQSAPYNSDLVVGQGFIVGIHGIKVDSQTTEFLRHIKPGGIILYKRENVLNDTQLGELIAGLQKLARETTGVPYLIIIDEEPGGATRLDMFKDIKDSDTIQWGDINTDVLRMRKLGINVNLAPIADFSTDGKNFLASRSPFRTTESLIRFNQKFISILEQHTIGSTLKHFPGIGFFPMDPHKGIVRFQTATSTLDQSFAVFKKGIEAGASFVMTNHGVYSGIDSTVSATFSPKTINLLRNTLNFKGIIITDDVSSMPFLLPAGHASSSAAIDAFMAGHTMVMYSWGQEKAREAYMQTYKEYTSKKSVRDTLNANYDRILEYKKRLE